MRKSQFKMILEALKRGEKITPLDALGRFGCFSLPARIFEMKRAGYRIKTEMIEIKSGKKIARYQLEKNGTKNERDS